MQLFFYFNQTRCTGCLTCVVACKDWNNIPPQTVNWIRVQSYEKGKFPNPKVFFMINKCHHCQDPACLKSCPPGAIYKRKEDGIVVVKSDLCLGKNDCGLCYETCPYKSPQFREENGWIMEKCNFCLERWTKGKKPICVMSCPTRALDAGTMEEIEKLYGKVTEAMGFVFSIETKPSIYFKPKQI